jgi:hypothetical protein
LYYNRKDDFMQLKDIIIFTLLYLESKNNYTNIVTQNLIKYSNGNSLLQ